jgi:hypothetical protein
MKVIVLNFVFVLIAGALMAQNAPSNGGATGTERVNPQNVETVKGCLSKSGNTYALLGGNPVRQYRIIGGNVAALQGMQGHTVEVTGVVGEKISGASPDGMYNSGSTTGVGYDTITAESVKQIAANCG